MIIHVENQFAWVSGCANGADLWLYDFLAWRDNTAQFRRRFGYKGDGFIRLYNRFNGSFPAGFVRLVANEAKAKGRTVTIVDKRTKPVLADMSANLDWLRDYQLAAVDIAVKRTKGVLWCPTGSGKTEIAIALTKRLPCKWLFLAHRAELTDQAAKRYNLRTGLEAGIVGDGKFAVKQFTCATFQSLYARLKRDDREARQLLSDTEGFIIDECHTMPADSFYKVAMSMPNAYYRIGVSGTPLARSDRKSMLIIGATGPVIYRIEAEKLISEGVLARPTIKMVEVIQTSERVTWAGVYRESVVNSKKRNLTIAKISGTAIKPCLIFVQHISHGQNLEATLRNLGHRVEYVDGASAVEKRLAAIKRLSRGDIDVLICTVIFNEGVDIPDLRSVVIASGGASAIAALQRVGRGMRKAAGKDTFEVWDIDDTGQKWLERHTAERIKAYNTEGYEIVKMSSL